MFAWPWVKGQAVEMALTPRFSAFSIVMFACLMLGALVEVLDWIRVVNSINMIVFSMVSNIFIYLLYVSFLNIKAGLANLAPRLFKNY